MIQLSTSQIAWLTGYVIVFTLAISLFLAFTNDHPHKRPEQILPYFAIFLLILILFIAGMYFTLASVTHFHIAAVCLVTLKYSDAQSKYINVKTELLCAEDEEKVNWYFKHRVQALEFYEYHLIDDKGTMQTFNCVTPELLQRVQDTVIKSNEGEIFSLEFSKEPTNK